MADESVKESTISFCEGQSSLEELSGAQPIQWNLLKDPGGAVRQRPGLRAWADFPTVAPNASPVVQAYAWRTFLIYVCEDRTIWAWYGPGDVRALSDSTAATRLDGSLRPVFSYDYQRVVITGGGAPQKWEGAGLSARLGGPPPTSTHIAYSAQRFVVSIYDNTGVIQWTPPGVGNHETWTTQGVGAGGFSEAEAAPDPVQAMAVNTNEVYVFGTQTTQVFVPDPDTDFSVASTLGIGCGARYSVIDTDGDFAWLDERHRFVTSGGRSFEAISSPAMAKSIAELGTVSDCWGFRSRIGSFDLLVWVFPTEGRTIVYDRGSQKFSEWKGWTDREWSDWIGRSYFFWPNRNVHLVGLGDGRIAEMTFDTQGDMDANIKGISRTGFGDDGTALRKLCQRVDLTMKRGATLPGVTAPTVELRYRNDLGAFSPAVNYSLGAAEYTPTIQKWALGMYRDRQWELAFENNAEFVLTGARAQIEMGDS